MPPLLAVVIPVYNERELLHRALARFDAVPPPRLPAPAPRGAPTVDEPFAAPAPTPAPGTGTGTGTSARIDRRLFVVDDGSTDGTTELVRALSSRPDTTPLAHAQNKGKGAALRTGIEAALKAGADIVLIHDADLEYDPADHEAALAPILEGRADVVFGSRFLGQSHRVLYFWHFLANRFITLCSDIATNLNLTDVECCTKAFTRAALEPITIHEDRFGVEIELVAKAARLRFGPDLRKPRIYEVGVSYAGRTYAEGKKITWRDGVAALWCIFKYRVLR